MISANVLAQQKQKMGLRRNKPLNWSQNLWETPSAQNIKMYNQAISRLTKKKQAHFKQRNINEQKLINEKNSGIAMYRVHRGNSIRALKKYLKEHPAQPSTPFHKALLNRRSKMGLGPAPNSDVYVNNNFLASAFGKMHHPKIRTLSKTRNMYTSTNNLNKQQQYYEENNGNNNGAMSFENYKKMFEARNQPPPAPAPVPTKKRNTLKKAIAWCSRHAGSIMCASLLAGQSFIPVSIAKMNTSLAPLALPARSVIPSLNYSYVPRLKRNMVPPPPAPSNLIRINLNNRPSFGSKVRNAINALRKQGKIKMSNSEALQKLKNKNLSMLRSNTRNDIYQKVLYKQLSQ